MTVYLDREEELLGTAGGVKRLADHFDDTFVVVSGDALTDVNIGSSSLSTARRGRLPP
jgi:NDP-sugar pyrophosphorylase family protein